MWLKVTVFPAPICKHAVVILLVLASVIANARETEVIQINQDELWVRWDDVFLESEKQRIRDWLIHTAQSVTTINGRLAQPYTRVVMERSDRLASRGGRSPVPWGEVIREGIEGVRFVVDLNKSQQEFISDWTAAHEFSHLFLPYLGVPDRWLSEGFASYYQNVAMARAGDISPSAAWQNLYEGFERASRDTNYRNTLVEVSKRRRELRATMRVYWSGALFFLEADLAIRQKYSGKSLDSIITEFNACCRYSTHHWTGKKLMGAFDSLLEEPVFSPLYLSYRDSHRIPDYQQLLENLGLEVRAEDMQLNDVADKSLMNIRDAIMAR